MNREVHVRFCESAGLRRSAPLTYIKAYGSVTEARRGIGGWLGFYNEKRPHQALGYVDNACALPTYSQAHHQEEEVIMY